MVYRKILKKLFLRARENGGVQYIFTLVRKEGIRSFKKDLFLDFRKFLYKNKKIKTSNIGALKNKLEKILSAYSIYTLMANLINNAEGKRYRFNPLSVDLKEIDLENNGLPSEKNLYINNLFKIIKHYKKSSLDLYNAFERIFSSKLLSNKINELPSDPIWYKDKLKEIFAFFIDFLDLYFENLKSFKDYDKFYKFKDFEVLELLVNKTTGLYGLNIHHSNGSSSTFKRTENSTKSVNFLFNSEGEVETIIGHINKTKPMWMIRDEPLYKMRLRGRYNEMGEWKPIVYPGDSSIIQKEIKDLTKDKEDTRIQGCLFYIMTTCYHVIEFILKCDFDLPHKYNTVKSNLGDIVMHKINLEGKESNYLSNTRIYDCTLKLPGIKVEDIEKALWAIDVTLNRIALRLNGKVDWLTKYPSVDSRGGVISTEKKDSKILSDYLTKIKGKDASLFDASISWYVSGNNSTNIFTKFLSYCIALEGLAIPFIKGKMEIGKEYQIKQLSKDKEKGQKDCIFEKYSKLYKTDPVRFINESYFECILGLNKLIKEALQKVFGKDHKFVKLFFDKIDKHSLYDLRHKLAHGSFTLIVPEHQEIIQKRLPDLEKIVYEFILRLSMKIKPGKKYKKFNKFSLALVTSDPRTTMVASDLSFIPNKNWKIKPEWLI